MSHRASSTSSTAATCTSRCTRCLTVTGSGTRASHTVDCGVGPLQLHQVARHPDRGRGRAPRPRSGPADGGSTASMLRSLKRAIGVLTRPSSPMCRAAGLTSTSVEVLPSPRDPDRPGRPAGRRSSAATPVAGVRRHDDRHVRAGRLRRVRGDGGHHGDAHGGPRARRGRPLRPLVRRAARQRRGRHGRGRRSERPPRPGRPADRGAGRCSRSASSSAGRRRRWRSSSPAGCSRASAAGP